VIHWAEAAGKAAAVKQRLMELYFRDGGDLTERDVLVQAAADCGLDADSIRRRLSTDEDVDVVSGEAQAAANAGVSGVPTFILGGKYGISGAQPAEQLAAAIRQVAEEMAGQGTA
jgi:predicted DsbA family dithiol-disulfide isomerase